MTAKEYLNRVWLHRLHCQMLAEKIEELRNFSSGVKGITYDKDKIQTSPANKLEESTIKVLELQDRLNRKMMQFEQEDNVIREQVMNMPNQLHVQVLQLRYLTTDNGQRMSFERIACIMRKSYSRVRHIHGQALKEFERLYLKSDTKKHTT